MSQKTFNQAFNYNNTIGAPLIWLTNGLQHLYWDCENNKQLEQLPNNA
ncbi:MAG: type I restriction enzyme HsdR N-terminal domain-containing protein [Schleiferiaceae bacterium]